MSSYQFAKEIGIHVTTVTNWLNGTTPRKGMQVQLAKYFGIPWDYLSGASDNPALNPITEDHAVISAHEQKLLAAYRAKPEMQSAVDLLLGLDYDSTD